MFLLPIRHLNSFLPFKARHPSLSLSLISPEKKPQLCSVRLQIDKTRLLSNSAQKTCGKLLSIDGPLKNMYRRHGNKVNPFLFSRFFLHLEQQHEPGKRS